MRTHPFCLVVLSLILAGCGHETAPTSPSTMASRLGMDAAISPFAQSKLGDLWPNDNGHVWSFTYRSEEVLSPPGPTLYPTAAQVPPAPTPEELLPTLRTPIEVGNGRNGSYTLVFDGQTTTLSGATGQNLRETLVIPGRPLRPAVAPDLRQRLMTLVARARPDLRNKIVALGEIPAVDTLTTYPLLVHGGCWEKTLDHIGTFGDLDQELAWKFLDADTKQGASFRFQLLPSITTDVFLTAWVVPHKLESNEAKGKAIEVVYVIDYGVDQTGSPSGYFRAIGYGSVIYMPGQGPVSSLERSFAWVEHPEQPLTQITVGPGPFVVGLP